MNGATVALLGVLSASAGLLRLIDLPGGGSGIFFLVVLAGAAFGPRFGLLLGLCSMAVSAIVTGGIGPWLPFQMLALGWMGGGAGLARPRDRRLDPPARGRRARGLRVGVGLPLRGDHEPVVLAVRRAAVRSTGSPGSSSARPCSRYWCFYVATSLGWDAAAAIANALLILVTGARDHAHAPPLRPPPRPRRRTRLTPSPLPSFWRQLDPL